MYILFFLIIIKFLLLIYIYNEINSLSNLSNNVINETKELLQNVENILLELSIKEANLIKKEKILKMTEKSRIYIINQ